MSKICVIFLIGFLQITSVFADSWIDTCKPGDEALKYALANMENEEFSKDLCNPTKKQFINKCRVYWKEVKSLGTKVLHTVKLSANSGNTYEFLVEQDMTVLMAKDGSYCELEEIRLIDYN